MRDDYFKEALAIVGLGGIIAGKRTGSTSESPFVGACCESQSLL
jgi:hypothetical protein